MVRSIRRKQSFISSSIKSDRKKQKMSDLDDNPLCLLVTKCGFIFSNEMDQPNELGVDQIIFQKELSKVLKSTNNQTKSELIDGLLDLWKDHKRFCFSLLPTVSADICVNSSRGKQQESFVRLLLGISHLQTPVAIALLEKLPEISIDEELLETAAELGDINLYQRIVDQLRWLEKIYDSKILIDKVFEIISISDVEVQRELILCVPDFMDESNHDNVVCHLHELLCGNSNLISSLMEALSCINLKPNLLEQIRNTAIEILNSADISDIAGIVKFLQQSANEKSVHQIVAEIREKVDFVSSSFTATPANRRKEQKNENKHAEIFSAVKTGVLFQKMISDEWIKILESISSFKQQKILDLFVLLVLIRNKAKSKVIETLMRTKIKKRIFTQCTVTLAFEAYCQVFSEYLQEIMQLAESFIRSPESIVSSYGMKLYCQSFIYFNNESKQKIVEALVMHIIGNNHAAELEVAISILCFLMSEHYEKISLYAATIKKLGEYIENLSIPQMRKLFSILAKLYNGNINCDSNDDLQEMIFRNLSSSTWRLKRIGVIGVMMVVASLGQINPGDARQKNKPNESEAQEQILINSVAYKKVINYLKMAQDSTKSQPEALSLFYDELANIVFREKLEPKVLAWISEKVFTDFQNEFLLDAELVKNSKDQQMQLSFDLDQIEEGGISINILPLLTNKKIDKNGEMVSSEAKMKNKLVYLHSHFRMVQICEKVQNGNLDGIDALLGCPLVLFNQCTLEKFSVMSEQDRSVVCAALIYAINWIREVINAFAMESADHETQTKILNRLKTLVALTETLEQHLVLTPDFKLPLADYSIDENLLSSIKSVKAFADAKIFKKPKKSKLKKKSTEENEEDKSSDKEDNLFENGCQDSNNQSILLTNFPASLRPLDLNVFNILLYENVLLPFGKNNKDTGQENIFSLSSTETIFLLKDFQMKLEHSLNSNGRNLFLKQSITKLIGFSKLPCPVDVMRFYVKLQPVLVLILKKCFNYFEKCITDNGNVVDSKERKSAENKHALLIYELVFDCLHIVLQWNGFELNKESLIEILQCFYTQNKSTHQLSDSAAEFFQSILSYESSVTSIHLAVTLVKVLHLTLKWSIAEKKMKKKISEVATSFLERLWYDSNGEKDRGPVFNTNFAYLIRISVTMSEEPLDAIDDICNGPLTDLDKKNIDENKRFPSLTKSVLPACYKCIFEELNATSKLILNITTKASDEEIPETMVKVEKSIKIFHILVDIVKNTEGRTLLGSALKCSRIYLETFLKYAMPLLEKTLRSQKDLVHANLKNLQQSTRSLQHICGHTKFAKDSSLTAFVPALKKCLETFVFRVKALLAFNNCENAFWLGNLKNRDLKGNEISSQVESSITEEESMHEEDEESAVDEDEGNENKFLSASL